MVTVGRWETQSRYQVAIVTIAVPIQSYPLPRPCTISVEKWLFFQPWPKNLRDFFDPWKKLLDPINQVVMRQTMQCIVPPYHNMHSLWSSVEPQWIRSCRCRRDILINPYCILSSRFQCPLKYLPYRFESSLSWLLKLAPISSGLQELASQVGSINYPLALMVSPA